MDLTQHDMEELRQEAEKSLALGSPFTRRTVMVDAEKLVWLLDTVQERQQPDDYTAELEQENSRLEEELEQKSREINRLETELVARE
jgi:hypothetical protein